MDFVDSYMLWGAAAVAVPILLHFFFRSRYRTVPWAAMKFLLLSIEQTSRRLKFQELLLLIVRCALLALLAFALARPLFSSAGASGREAVDAVFVFDTSFSMGAREGKQSRLDHAKSTALAIMEHLPPYSTVQVVTCADKADLLGPRDPDKLDLARALIKKIELTDLATDLAPGVTEAVAALERGTSPNKELYVFSDMQKLGWDANAAALTKALKDVHATTRIYLVRCAEQVPRNVAVIGIAPQSGIPRPGERVGFAVLVRNTGIVPVQNLRVALAVDGKDRDREEQAIAELDPGETRALTLTAKIERPGLRVLTATVEQDDLEADNRFDQVILVRDQLRVLVIDGGADLKEPRNSSSYYLMHALLPVKDELRAKYHVRATELTPRQASAAELSRNDVCILVNTALERDPRRIAETLPADFVENLRGFVSKGGGLIIFGGDNVAAEPYNRILGKRLGLLPLKLAGTASYPLDQPIVFDRNSIESASYLRFKEDEDFKDLASVGIWRTLDVEEQPRQPSKEAGKEAKADPTRVLMRYSNGKPALVSRKVDSGEVLLVATSADPGLKPGTNEPTWNILPLWIGYVPFVEASLNHLLHRQAQNHNFTAGETLHWHPDPRDAGRSFALEYPPEDAKTPGKRVPLGRPDSVQGRPVVTATGLQRAGVYHLTAADRGEGGEAAAEGEGQARQKKFQPLPFAVVPDLRESANLESLSDKQIDERLGFRPVHLKSGGNVNVTAETERSNQEWTLWLLAAVLLLAVCESVLAWFCGRAW